jgi:hypothetical protein
MLRGYTARGSVAVDRLGNVSGHQPSFAALSAAGARAFARDLGRRWWQSTDYGATWIEVAGPPSNSAALAIGGDPDCALAGCFVGTLYGGAAGAWLRVGWPVEPPAATPTEGAGGEAL